MTYNPPKFVKDDVVMVMETGRLAVVRSVGLSNHGYRFRVCYGQGQKHEWFGPNDLEKPEVGVGVLLAR